MRVYNDISELVPIENPIVTVGMFDGVHKGHQQIMNRLKATAAQRDGETVVVTFWPHPRAVLNPDDTSLRLLNSFEEKVQLLKEQGIDHLLKIPFTKEFSQMSSQQFLDDIIIEQLNTRSLIVGYDHRFGKNREGDFDELEKYSEEYGFELEKIAEKEMVNIGIVSSSQIRESLLKGDVDGANILLGQPYCISGCVIKGKKIGRLMGFPTANVEVDFPQKLIPREGIYSAIIEYNNMDFGGMLYIGNRPTLYGADRSIEVNLFDFNKDLYGETIFIRLISLIREDAKFKNIDTLTKQIKEDKNSSLDTLRKRNIP